MGRGGASQRRQLALVVIGETALSHALLRQRLEGLVMSVEAELLAMSPAPRRQGVRGFLERLGAFEDAEHFFEETVRESLVPKLRDALADDASASPFSDDRLINLQRRIVAIADALDAESTRYADDPAGYARARVNREIAEQVIGVLTDAV